MNNDPCIIFAVEGNRLLVDIQRVSDNTCSPPNEYLYESWHLSEFVCNVRIGSPTHPGAPKVLSSTPICSQTYHNRSHGTPVPVIRDPSYSKGQLECPSRVWYSPEIDSSKFTHHILSDTPWVFQILKYILLMTMQYLCAAHHHLGHGKEVCTWLLLWNICNEQLCNCHYTYNVPC